MAMTSSESGRSNRTSTISQGSRWSDLPRRRQSLYQLLYCWGFSISRLFTDRDKIFNLMIIALPILHFCSTHESLFPHSRHLEHQLSSYALLSSLATLLYSVESPTSLTIYNSNTSGHFGLGNRLNYIINRVTPSKTAKPISEMCRRLRQKGGLVILQILGGP